MSRDNGSRRCGISSMMSMNVCVPDVKRAGGYQVDTECKADQGDVQRVVTDVRHPGRVKKQLGNVVQRWRSR